MILTPHQKTLKNGQLHSPDVDIDNPKLVYVEIVDPQTTFLLAAQPISIIDINN